MKQKIIILITIWIVSLFTVGCDSRRNQILSNLLTSPTATETPIPPTATPEATPTALPTPTPTPVIAAENLDLLMFGDFDLADYNIAARINNSEVINDMIIAQTDKIESAYLQSDFPKCMTSMDELSETLRGTSERPKSVLAKAYYLYAQCASETGEKKTEIDSLEKYLEYRPDSPILPEVCSEMAYAYRELGDHEMFRNYLDVSGSHSETGNNDYVKLDYAVSYSLEGNNDEAIRQLTDLYNNSADENIKAGADYYLGTVYEATGLRDQVIARYQDAVNNYPKTYYSYLALLWLLDNNQTVSDYQRGLINFYRGQYSLANEAFRRYVKSEPGNDGSSWYFIGVCQMNLADYEGAVTSYTKLIEEYPSNRYYVSAWDELAYVQWVYLERYRKAAETLTDYVSRHPDQADSASFLFEAGRILERGRYLSDAAKTWARLIDEYPLYENSKTALFLAAISSYRIGDYETALAHLNRLLLVSGIPDDQAQANFWIAKIYQRKHDDYNMKKYLDKAAEQSRTGYYSLRAAELSAGKDYLSSPTSYDFSIDLKAERQIADQWMMITFTLDSSQLTNTAAYMSDPDYLKAEELFSLGQYQQAVISFDNVREKIAEDPAASYAFLSEMLDKNIYSVSAYTSRQILSAAGLYEDDRTLEVPNYFNHIRFGPWYLRYVDTAGREYNISPFILYSLMKQESMFNPWVTSPAGARGLMQIMPATGLEISKNLHWPNNYQEEDLNRVPVAVSFSASLLKQLKTYFNESNAAMLAAYNGGAGNTQKWIASSDNDPDLLYEVIRFEETRNYLHNIYRNAKIYEWLYGK